MNLLLPLPVPRDRAWALVSRVPIDSKVYREIRGCRGACCKQGPTHGPYWFARVRGRGVFIGVDEKLAELRAAWEVVRAEIEEFDSRLDPETVRLLDMKARAFGLVVTDHRPNSRAPDLLPKG